MTTVRTGPLEARYGSWPAPAPGVGQPVAQRTVGVEEEFVLLDPASGAPVLAAPDLLRLLDGERGAQAEFMRFQFETATRVCAGLDEIRGELLRLRRTVASAAEHLGCRLVASGTVPFVTPGVAALTDQPRYRALARQCPVVAPESGTCACQVHVGVPSRDLGVQVLVRLRPWLAPLLALTVNSPIAAGRDTGCASWRYRVITGWPTVRPPARWTDAAHYDETVRRLIQRGAAIDQASIYFLARLSARYPTVEVRVADACLDVDTAVLLAALVRALVTTSLEEIRTGVPARPGADRWVDAGIAAAARYGLAGAGVDPFTGENVTQRSLLHRLLNHVAGALDAADDTGHVVRLLRLLDARGTGAERQRALWARAASATEFTEALARATVAPAEPVGGLPAARLPVRR